MMWYNLNISLY